MFSEFRTNNLKSYMVKVNIIKFLHTQRQALTVFVEFWLYYLRCINFTKYVHNKDSQPPVSTVNY